MLTDTQIEDLAQRMSIPLAGVFFKNELPKQLEPNKTYIINLQDSETDDGEQNEGTHWTMLQVNKTPNGKYFLKNETDKFTIRTNLKVPKGNIISLK